MAASTFKYSIAALLFLAGCNTTQQQQSSASKQQIGTLLGAGVGALIAAKLADPDSRQLAVIIGALGGAFLGSEIGRSLDIEDRRRAAAAQQIALENNRDGVISTWVNPNTEARGAVVPTRTFRGSSGQACREYEHSVIIDGRSEVVRGTACRREDGTWRTQNPNQTVTAGKPEAEAEAESKAPARPVTVTSLADLDNIMELAAIDLWRGFPTTEKFRVAVSDIKPRWMNLDDDSFRRANNSLERALNRTGTGRGNTLIARSVLLSVIDSLEKDGLGKDPNSVRIKLLEEALADVLIVADYYQAKDGIDMSLQAVRVRDGGVITTSREYRLPIE